MYILIGLVIGAYMYGYIPQEFFVTYLGKDNFWAVPLAAVVGIPIYASQAGIVPLVQVLLPAGCPAKNKLKVGFLKLVLAIVVNKCILQILFI